LTHELQRRAAAKQSQPKATASPAPAPAPVHTAADSISAIQGLLQKFRSVGRLTSREYDKMIESGNDISPTSEEVNGHLGNLNKLNASDLLSVARAVNAHATLTEKTPKAKIVKQISDMVRSVWKGSQNIHH